MRGTLATFTSPEELKLAVEIAREAGLKTFDPVTPYPEEEIFDATPKEREISPLGQRFPRLNVIGTLALAGGVTGMLTGFGLQWIANSWAEPMSAGGRPFFSWPNYVPITFVLSILFSAGTVFLSLFLLLRLPEPHHPYFDTSLYRFDYDRFYLFIPMGDLAATALARVRERVPAAQFEEVST